MFTIDGESDAHPTAVIGTTGGGEEQIVSSPPPSTTTTTTTGDTESPAIIRVIPATTPTRTGATTISPDNATTAPNNPDLKISRMEQASPPSSSSYSANPQEFSPPPTDIDDDGPAPPSSPSSPPGTTVEEVTDNDDGGDGGKSNSNLPASAVAMMPLAASALSSYHPSYLFCGECASCAPPPPPQRRGQGGGVGRNGGQNGNKKLNPDAVMNLAIHTGEADWDGPSTPERATAADALCCEDPGCLAGKVGAKSSVAMTDVVYGDDGEAQLNVSPIRNQQRKTRQVSEDSIGEGEEDIEMTRLTSADVHGSMSKRESGHNRSHFYVLNLTCPSQILVLNSILQPIPGVTKVIIPAVKTKIVHVDHDPFLAPANMLAGAMRRHGYDARLKKDGGSALLGEHPEGICRSQIWIRNMNTTSDITLVRAVIENVEGSSKVAVNLTTRIVYVDHDPFKVTTAQLAKFLRKEGFRAKVKHDGGKAFLERQAEIKVGRSHFYVSGICCASEIPAIMSILEPLSGVQRVRINVTHKLVYVDHDVNQMSATGIAEHLSNGGFMAVIRRDANAQFVNASPRASKYVESTLLLSELSFEIKPTVERALDAGYPRKDEVRTYLVHVPSHTVKVEHDPNLVEAECLARTVRKALGKDEDDVAAVRVTTDGRAEGRALPLTERGGSGAASSSIGGGGMALEEGDKLHLNVILSGICWVISMLSVIGGNWEYLEYAGLLALLFGLPPVAAKAWKTLRRKQFDANCMMVIAALGAAALGEFDEAASVAFLFSVSEWLESRATLRARRALGSIVNLRPERANLLVDDAKGKCEGENGSGGDGEEEGGEEGATPQREGGGEGTAAATDNGASTSNGNGTGKSAYNSSHVVVVPASSVIINSLVSVRTGDKVPTDGVVVEGASQVDESSLTGEARPILKGVGDAVSGGSINVGRTQLIVRTTSTVEDSAVSRLIRLVEESQANRSPTEKLVDSFAKHYTPFVVLLAILMCTVPWIKGPEVGRQWVYNALIIIVIACPCALTISTPVTYAAGLAATAQRGVIVKGGARLEALGRVKKIVFDKTGTVTEGRFALAHLNTIGDTFTRKQVLQLLALMEASSNHPLSACLVNAAKEEGVPVPKDAKVTDHSILEGEGITAVLDFKNISNARCYVGNQRLFERVGLFQTLPVESKVDAEEWCHQGGTIGFIGIENVGIVGAFCVMDSIRPEAKNVVTTLQHEYGMEVSMLTGDSEGAAAAVGKRIGLVGENVKSRLLPEDKLHIVASMMEAGVGNTSASLCNPHGKRGLILLCGDGVNDAPAMAVADVGVAMGSGAALAMEMSDVTLLDSNLNKLLFSIKMGKRVIFTIKENIILSLVTKLIVVGLTFAGLTTLLSAIVTDVGVMLAVTLNGMKLLPRKRDYQGDDSGRKMEIRQRAPRTCKYHEVPVDGGHPTLPEVV